MVALSVILASHQTPLREEIFISQSENWLGKESLKRMTRDAGWTCIRCWSRSARIWFLVGASPNRAGAHATPLRRTDQRSFEHDRGRSRPSSLLRPSAESPTLTHAGIKNNRFNRLAREQIV